MLGPVGPDIIGQFSPNIAPTKDKTIAPQIPAAAPSPDATPKARA